ncbi:neprilysin-1-like isoform X2 [Haemaphysalis longicornis]
MCCWLLLLAIGSTCLEPAPAILFELTNNSVHNDDTTLGDGVWTLEEDATDPDTPYGIANETLESGPGAACEQSSDCASPLACLASKSCGCPERAPVLVREKASFACWTHSQPVGWSPQHTSTIVAALLSLAFAIFGLIGYRSNPYSSLAVMSTKGGRSGENPFKSRQSKAISHRRSLSVHPQFRSTAAARRASKASKKNPLVESRKKGNDRPTSTSDPSAPKTVEQKLRVSSAVASPDDPFPLRAASPAPVPRRFRSPALIGVVLAAFLLLMVLSGLLVYAMFARAPVSVGYCDWPGCISHVKELRASMNATVNPCNNFYTFVCGSWKPLWGERNMVERMYAKSFIIAARDLKEDNDPVLPIVQQFYNTCRRNRSDVEIIGEVEQFKAFKQGMGLMWPELPQPADKDFLHILLNMTIRWNIHLLFYARAWRQLGGRGQTLFVRRGSLEPTWPEKGFARVVMEHCHVLSANGCNESVPSLREVVRNIHKAVVTTPVDTTNEMAFSLGDISRFIRGRPQWHVYLNEVYGDHSSWHANRTVVLQDVLILQNLGALLRKYSSKSDSTLLMGLSWVFIYTHLWVFTGQVELRRSPERLQRPEPGELACLKLTEGLFGLAVSAKHIYQRYDASMRANVTDLFARIKGSVKSHFIDALWIHDAIKQAFFLKLDAMNMDTLPPAAFFSKERLRELYADFPAISTTSFVQNYIDVSDALRKKLTDEASIDVYVKSLEGTSHGRVAGIYHHYYNSVSMGLGVLEPPLLHAVGTLATKFGSAGTLLAASVVRSFDKLGVQLNYRGENYTWWVPSGGYRDRVNCDLRSGTTSVNVNNTAEKRAVAISVPLRSFLIAVGIGFHAYRGSLPKKGQDDFDADDFRLLGMEQYSDDQMFFISYCLMTCAADSNSDMCNVPVAHSRLFSRAFRCPLGAPMNPRSKCNFF